MRNSILYICIYLYNIHIHIYVFEADLIAAVVKCCKLYQEKPENSDGDLSTSIACFHKKKIYQSISLSSGEWRERQKERARGIPILRIFPMNNGEPATELLGVSQPSNRSISFFLLDSAHFPICLNLPWSIVQ